MSNKETQMTSTREIIQYYTNRYIEAEQKHLIKPTDKNKAVVEKKLMELKRAVGKV